MRLLELPKAALELIDRGVLSKGHGKALLAEPADSRRIELAQRAAAEGWSVGRLAGAISKRPASAQTEHPAAPAEAVARELARRLDGQTIAAKATVQATRRGFVIRLEAADRDQANAILARLADPNQ